MNGDASSVHYKKKKKKVGQVNPASQTRTRFACYFTCQPRVSALPVKSFIVFILSV
jgi:hypothetical protein